MTGDQEDSKQPRRYPWERTLMIITLYIALLVFLWYFPLLGVRKFFQTLLMGFLYLLSGLALVGITALFFFFVPLPHSISDSLNSAEADAEEDSADPDSMESQEGMPGEIRALMVADLKTERADLVWDVLNTLSEEIGGHGVLLFDPETGIVAVSDTFLTPAESTRLFLTLKARLHEQGIKARAPR